jgi:hypothetical protein
MKYMTSLRGISNKYKNKKREGKLGLSLLIPLL